MKIYGREKFFLNKGKIVFYTTSDIILNLALTLSGSNNFLGKVDTFSSW